MRLGYLFLACDLAFLPFRIAHAETQPDTFSTALGYANFDKTEKYRKSADLRFEYRWGYSLLPAPDSKFNNVNNYLQIHPFVGVETSSYGVLYGLGGFAMDVQLISHVMLTWSEGAGLFYPGYSMPMGSVFEIRSQGELGWKFDNNYRIAAYLSHTSNAKITERNPGSEVVGLYLHVPLGATPPQISPRASASLTYVPYYMTSAGSSMSGTGWSGLRN